jgi:hypothetical protein
VSGRLETIKPGPGVSVGLAGVADVAASRKRDGLLRNSLSLVDSDTGGLLRYPGRYLPAKVHWQTVLGPKVARMVLGICTARSRASPRGIVGRRIRPGARLLSAAAIALLGAAALAPTDAFSACAPATGSNITVTCSGATLNQGPAGNTGYGDGTQSGLTINVQGPASVTGTATGIDVGSGANNTINNLGIITTSGIDVYGITGGASLTVVNSGTIGNFNVIAGINANDVGLKVTNNAGGIINGQSTAIQGAGLLGVGTATVINSG